METTEAAPTQAPEVTALPAVPEENKPAEVEIAYIIKDAYFADFQVVKSLNAWWMNSEKVSKLIDGFKAGLTVKACWVYAGISKDQFYYFMKVHPGFSDVIEACEEVQMLAFADLLNKEGRKDLPTARWFMDRRHPKFAVKVKAETDAPLQPTVNIAIGANVDAGTIQAAIREIAREVFASGRGAAQPAPVGADAVVAGEGEGGPELLHAGDTGVR